MRNIDWNIFNVKNQNCQETFEEMCLHMFCRELNINSHDICSNFNQAGLETEPYLYNEKYYGFQSKYITNGNNGSFYTQLYKSLKKAVNLYNDKLDIIYVYTNLNIKPNPSDKEISKDKDEKQSDRIKIINLMKENKIEIKYITTTNFQSYFSNLKNDDLYRRFFSPENEIAFMENSISSNERTFLNSIQFLDLPINNSTFSILKDEIIKNNSLILGYAGSGKTEIMKSVFLELEKQFFDLKNQNASIPVYVRLRECINGNLETLIRQRLQDYYMNNDNNRKYIYLLDGIDELSQLSISTFISQLKTLQSSVSTDLIIFSSRPNSFNLTSVCTSIELEKYEINPLNEKFIEQYFKIKNNDFTKIESFSLTENIDDILSITLLYENINKLDEHTTKIDLIEYNIGNMLSNNNELEKLNIPIPYTKTICDILKKVAIFLHDSNSIIIPLNKIQEIISNLYTRLSYKDIDDLISYLSGLFFDSSSNIQDVTIYSFRHKRYFEYFLYVYISEIFYENPFILREKQLLTNKDFIINIFFTQELKINKINQNLVKIATLLFFQDYLGRDYFLDNKNKWIELSNFTLSGDDTFLQSDYFLSYMCQKNEDELKVFFEINLSLVSSFLTNTTYLKFIKMYHEKNSIDIRIILSKYFPNYDNDPRECEYNSYDYYKVISCEVYSRLFIEKESIDNFYHELNSTINLNSIELEFWENKALFSNEIHYFISFFNILLKYEINWILKNLTNFSSKILEILCYCIIQNKNINILLNNSQLTDIIINIIKDSNTDFYFCTKVLYTLKRNDKKFYFDLKKRFVKMNIIAYPDCNINFEFFKKISYTISNNINKNFFDSKESFFEKETNNYFNLYENFYFYTKNLYTIEKNDNKFYTGLKNDFVYKETFDYCTWDSFYEVNNYCAVILKRELPYIPSTYVLGISLAEFLMQTNFKLNISILDKILDEIKKFNFNTDNNFINNNSIFIGNIVSLLKLDVNIIKQFLFKLSEYETVISSFTVLYTIFQNNSDLFGIIANKLSLKSAYDNVIKDLTYYYWMSDLSFKYAAMLTVFDKPEAENICMLGINTSIFRPMGRKESLIKETLPNCIELTAINNWFTKNELENYIYMNFSILKIAEDTLDRAVYFDKLFEISKKYIPYSEVSSLIRECCDNNKNNYENDTKLEESNELDPKDINIDNLKDYYNCKIDNININNYSYWETLINFEFDFDVELKILYEVLYNKFSIYCFSKLSKCYKYIIAILLNNFETKSKFIEFIIKFPNHELITIIIEVFSITGNEQQGIDLFKSFMSLCELLVYIDKPYNTKHFSISYNIMSEIYSSNHLDWIVSDNKENLIYTKNREITISWNSSYDEEFEEEWATSHPAPKAYKRMFSILLNDKHINEVFLVSVDGGRGLIPMPKIYTNIISRNDYYFALIVNQNSPRVHEYIKRSKLIIE